AFQKLKIASSNGTVQASLPEWMSPTWMTSWMLMSALIVWMNAGVASNSAFRIEMKAGVVSQYGESPYTASVSVFGLPADDVAVAISSTVSAAPSAMDFLMSSSLRSMGFPTRRR